jgi:hypothetical protein
MRGMKIALGFVMATCLMMVVAAPAFAAKEWQHCEKVGVPKGSFSEHLCKTGEAGGEWEWLTIKTSEKSVLEGELELEDSESTLGAVRLKCKVKSTGLVEAEGKDVVEAAEVTGCKVVKGTCGSPKAEAVHLPWNTQLVEEAGGEVRDKIKNSGAGLPGYKVTCTVIIKVSDTCEAETSTSIANNLGESLVEASFEAKSGKAKCSLSKKESGSVTGTLKVKQANGWGLRVQ